MKLRILVLASFVAGLGASFALAAPGHPGGSGCHNVELKGTIANGALSLAVTGPGKKAAGQTVSLSVSGKASAQARVCGTGAAATYQLRNLKVDQHPAAAVPIGPVTTTP